MKVFKFGGASINSVERIQNLGEILSNYSGEPLLVIISAMGKTTNALEKVADSFYAGDKENALRLFQLVKESHLTTLKYLVTLNWKKAEAQLMDFFTEVEWLLHDKPVRDYDYYYDQIVCCGELLSTAIVNTYLEEIKIKSCWVDIRDVFRTDNNFREAVIDWDITTAQVTETMLPLLNEYKIVITQGFIGATDQNESTTLGREGSDYSGAVLANILNAESLTIWKDVEGVMNADPKKYPKAQYIQALGYTEIIEMAYYGAQVIHPKTIKPLQNRNIPLYVKCFLQPELAGTAISNKTAHHLPPIIVWKEHQVLMQLSSKDFSFVGEKPVNRLYELFAEIKIRPNLTQNGAISLLCCLDDNAAKIEKLAIAASELFDVQIEKGLNLLTVRHYNETIVEELTKGKITVLSQQTENTIQVLLRG
jgi:aspartate kinase